MADNCTSDATQGCENSTLIASINACCSETNTNLEGINTKLTTINSTLSDCCTSINTKLDTVISLLTSILNK